jgi:hypothetical protein
VKGELFSCGPGTSARCLELSGAHATGTGETGAALRRLVGGPPRTLALAADVRITNIVGGRWDVFGVYIDNATGQASVIELEIDAAGSMYLREYQFDAGAQTNNSSATANVTLANDKWYRIAFAVSVTGTTTSRAYVSVDDVPAAELAVNAHTMTNLGRFDFGDYQVDEGVTFKVRMDNLAATITP